jgi:uncharacterized membrane protein
MDKNRLEAFSDGVIAIIITIMVLDLKVPRDGDIAALLPLLPVFICYVLSFVMSGIYWSNHHHLFKAAEKVNGRILWANLHLLFWLSLIPFVTSWMGQSEFSRWPVAIYGVVMGFAGLAYFVLESTLVSYHGQDSILAQAVGGDRKGILSLIFYIVAIALAFVNPWLSFALYVTVAIMWLIPDRRIEQKLSV